MGKKTQGRGTGEKQEENGRNRLIKREQVNVEKVKEGSRRVGF